VYQIMSQFPNWFEFNEAYLIAILDELYRGRFGTFLMDSEREREGAGVYEETHSLWPWLMEKNRIKRFTNIEYASFEGVIKPHSSTSHLNVWMAYYGRYAVSMLQHQLHEEHTINHNMAHQLAEENAQLRFQLEREAAKWSSFANVLKEQILTQKECRDAIEKEVHKFSSEDNLARGDTLEVLVQYKDGQISFIFKDTASSSQVLPSLPPTQTSQKLANVDGIMIYDDYFNLASVPPKTKRNFSEWMDVPQLEQQPTFKCGSFDDDTVNVFLGEAVDVDKNTLPDAPSSQLALDYVTSAIHLVPYVTKAGANLAFNLLPAGCQSCTVSLGNALGLLKSYSNH